MAQTSVVLRRAQRKIPMLSTILKRLLDGLLVLWLTHLAVFIALRLQPGDPWADLAGDRALPAAAVARLQTLYGHGGNIVTQYVHEVGARLTGDFGQSLKIARGQEVTALLAAAAPTSLAIGCGALLVGLTLGLWAGISAARSRSLGRGRRDQAMRALSTLAI